MSIDSSPGYEQLLSIELMGHHFYGCDTYRMSSLYAVILIFNYQVTILSTISFCSVAVFLKYILVVSILSWPSRSAKRAIS